VRGSYCDPFLETVRDNGYCRGFFHTYSYDRTIYIIITIITIITIIIIVRVHAKNGIGRSSSFVLGRNDNAASVLLFSPDVRPPFERTPINGRPADDDDHRRPAAAANATTDRTRTGAPDTVALLDSGLHGPRRVMLNVQFNGCG